MASYRYTGPRFKKGQRVKLKGSALTAWAHMANDVGTYVGASRKGLPFCDVLFDKARLMNTFRVQDLDKVD